MTNVIILIKDKLLLILYIKKDNTKRRYLDKSEYLTLCTLPVFGYQG